MAKRILITGAADGIGLATAKAFADSGAEVHICDVDLGTLKLEPKGSFRGMHLVDVRREQDVKAMFDAVQTMSGGIDVLINNVGVSGPHAFIEDISVEEWADSMQANVGGAFFCLKYFLPGMKARRSGVVLNISSIGSFTLPPMRSVYATSKWAIEGLTKSLARELGPFNIRCNAILPGIVNNGRMMRIMKRRAESEARDIDELRKEYLKYTSMGRMIEVDEIAACAMFLSSDGARSITSQLIAVCGGVNYEE
jgi:NAD(P)-dependent dehydrogenase (short-subunit alcohol dehydrogenase family)